MHIFCCGYGKLILLWQLCVLFVTGFWSTGVVPIQRTKTVCHCWGPRKTHKVTSCSKDWRTYGSTFRNSCQLEGFVMQFHCWKYTAFLGDLNWTFCWFDYPLGALLMLKTLIEVEHINSKWFCKSIVDYQTIYLHRSFSSDFSNTNFMLITWVVLKVMTFFNI